MTNILTLAQVVAQILNTNPQDMKNTQIVPINPIQYVMLDEKKEDPKPTLVGPTIHGKVWRDNYGTRTRSQCNYNKQRWN